jgi:DNA-binding NarL/FixJ family response regulator
MKKVRILIADDHDVVRSGLRTLLRGTPEFAIVAEAVNGEEAVLLAGKHRPDVAILDISMPVLDGIGATRQIRELYPEIKIVILSVHEDEEYTHQILQAGAMAYLLKTAGKKEIVAAIRSVLAGEKFFSPGISRLITEGFVKRGDVQKRGAAGESEPGVLTEREIQVLQYVAQGYTNRQIADILFLSFRTINTHRSNLMQKLDIHDTAGLVRYAITRGLVKLDG